MHHIRPVESGLNSARNNSPYGEVSSSANALYYEDSNNNRVALGGHKENDVFEPLDNVKGDVARIIFYLYTPYNDYSNVGGTTNGSGGKFGDLDFSFIVDGSEEQAIGKNDPLVAQLKQWVDAEYENGRQNTLSRHELESKIEEYAPGRFTR